MLVIDESKMKLLKMTEKLLKVSNGTNEKALADYKALVLEIDEQLSTELINTLNNTNTHNYSLEEQLEFLIDIENDYNELCELRHVYEATYFEYSNEKLGLSDISDILIDRIEERKNTIQGYLINSKYIESNKKELEKLNYELVREEKKKEDVQKRLGQLDDELRNNFLNAEGRVYSNIGTSKYTSIIQEFKDNDLDLRKLLDDKDYFQEEFDKCSELEAAAAEKLEAAKICYQSMPSGENMDVYNAIEVDTAKIRYKLILLRMAALIQEKAIEYKRAIDKRREISALNDARIDNLGKLGIRMSIDAFSRIRLKEQLDIINSFGDNNEEIEIIRNKIDNYNTLVEDKMRQNNEFMLSLNDNYHFMRSSVVAHDVSSQSDSYSFTGIDDNKVIKVSDLTDGFMKKRVDEKTRGVIKRVNEVFNGTPTSEDKPEEVVSDELDVPEDMPSIPYFDSLKDYVSSETVSPELLIVPSSENVPEEVETFDANNDVNTLGDDVFPEIAPIDSVDVAITPSVETVSKVFETFDVDNKTDALDDDVFPEVVPTDSVEAEVTPSVGTVPEMFATLDVDNKTDDFEDDVFPTMASVEAPPVSETLSQVETANTDVFQNVVPFEAAPLFSDRYDDGVFNGGTAQQINDTGASAVVQVKETPVVAQMPTTISFVSAPIETSAAPSNEGTGTTLNTAVATPPVVASSPEMPEAFWPTQEESTGNANVDNADSNVLSFDEQVNALISDNNENAKVKKLVA